MGSVRLGGLAKHLPEFGWQPTILTHTLPDKPDPQFQVIQTEYRDRYARMEEGLKIQGSNTKKRMLSRLVLDENEVRRPYIERLINLIGEILSFPDGKKAWKPIALDAAHRLFNNRKVDLLFSSSSPVTTHLIAHDLKRRYNIPWMADLRDLWTQNHYYPYSPLRKFFERRLERKIFSQANALSTTSDPLADDLRRIHSIPSIHTIHNGFDPMEVEEVPLTDEFTITYAGALYQGKRDPGPLFQALEELIETQQIDPAVLDIRFYGRKQAWLDKKIQKYNFEKIAQQYGFLPRTEALKKQRESQLLLLLNWNDPREVGTYTGKIYEYLAARRPILSIGAPRGVVTDLLDQTQSGAYAINGEELKRVLMKYYHEYRTQDGIPYHGIEDIINLYSHREMAKKFSIVFDEILGNA